ncbi:GxGYxYP domain-containing protein [Streptomyces sp. LN785]|uniref:GxGYxYP domain-containing protein n=1 Tax=Streptomyces sp. LN785 TaxID=3112983 RepID=UPI003710230B
MVSRRTFLRVNGAAAAAGLWGLGQPSVARAEGVPSRLLPSFGRPLRLDVADVGDLPGGDQILLTTLQGVVNRHRPELYFTFSGGEADARWLTGIDVPKTHHADPMDLLAAYRKRVRGAIVPDPDVPSSINVATTLAGLEDAVVADEARAKAHGLPVVEDLRGRFGDSPDPVDVYRWQFNHLYPRCTRRLLAGLPPTMSVDVPGVVWHEVARETQQIRDSSNRKVRSLDLSPALGKDDVYLRFQDSFTADGWGPSVASMTVTADGRTLASFKAGSTEETPYLFDAGGSSIGAEANRFADGGGSFTYRFTPPAGTRQLTVEVDLWNQFLVTASDTEPNRVEPFPYFRDYVVATRAMVCWLPPSGRTGDLLAEIFAGVAPTTPYAGWFANDVSGEWDGVDLAARHGVEVLPADFYMNATVHSGVPARIRNRPRTVPKARLRPKVYLTLTFGEGDNVQYCQRRMRELWDDETRGSVPVNWTVSPLLADIGPALLAHYQHTATENDLLIGGPSGAGYTYVGAWPAAELDRYTELSGRYLRRTGMDLVYAYNNRDQDGWIPIPDAVGRSYREHTPVRGIIQSWELGGLVSAPGGVPLVGNFMPPGGNAASYRVALLEHVQHWDGTVPLFVAGAVNAWQWTPSDIAELVGTLPDPFEVVRGDTFFDLMRSSGTAPAPGGKRLPARG